MAWGAGSGDLPLGGCLVVEAVFVPILMVISDGFLMAWLLTELRNAGLDNTGEDRLDLRQAIALMPGSALACALALPARYVATFVWLGLGLSADLGPCHRRWGVLSAGSSAGD